MTTGFKKISIKAARIDKGLSQLESAEALGVARGTLSKWENGQSYPDVTFLDKFAELYEISRDQLCFKKN